MWLKKRCGHQSWQNATISIGRSRGVRRVVCPPHIVSLAINPADDRFGTHILQPYIAHTEGEVAGEHPRLGAGRRGQIRSARVERDSRHIARMIKESRSSAQFLFVTRASKPLVEHRPNGPVDARGWLGSDRGCCRALTDLALSYRSTCGTKTGWSCNAHSPCMFLAFTSRPHTPCGPAQPAARGRPLDR